MNYIYSNQNLYKEHNQFPLYKQNQYIPLIFYVWNQLAIINLCAEGHSYLITNMKKKKRLKYNNSFLLASNRSQNSHFSCTLTPTRCAIALKKCNNMFVTNRKQSQKWKNNNGQRQRTTSITNAQIAFN